MFVHKGKHIEQKLEQSIRRNSQELNMKTFGIYFECLTDFVARQRPLGNEMANSIVTLNHQVCMLCRLVFGKHKPQLGNFDL